MIVRQSYLGAADSCLRKLQYDLTIPGRRSGSARAIGTAYHAGLEHLYLERAAGRRDEVTYTSMLSEADKAFDQEARSEGFLWDEEWPDKDTCMRTVAEMLKVFWEEGHEWPENWTVMGVEHRFSMEWEGHQRVGTVDLIMLDPNGWIVVEDHKAQPIDEPVLTSKGWVEMGRLRLGDMVVTEAGELAPITGIHPQGEVPVYKVTFSDGTETRCCADHLWKVRWANSASPWKVMSLREIMGLSSFRSMMVPWVQPFELDGVDPDVDPYTLGALLGDGGLTSSSSITFSSVDQPVLDRLVLGAAHLARDGEGPNYRIRGDVSSLRDELARLNVTGKMSHQKSVPAEVFSASHKYRLEVLRGLMDTDGHIHLTKGSSQFITTAPGLRDGVAALVRSLGGQAHVSPPQRSRLGDVEHRPHWRVSVRMDECPFHLPRKAERWYENGSRPGNKVFRSIEPDGTVEAQCITVGHPTQTYVTRDYIVTHNTARRAWPKGKEHPRKNNQAPWYIPMVRADFPGAHGYRFVFGIMTYGGKFERRIADPGPAHIAAVEAKALQLATLVDGMASAGMDLPANPSSNLCSEKWCDFFELCPHGRSLV